MKKPDLVEGTAYAVGSTSRYDKWRLVRATLIEVDGEREVPAPSWMRGGKQTKRGIVIRYEEDSTMFGHVAKAGEERVLDSARDVIEPWEGYEQKRAEHDRLIAEIQAEGRRQRDVADIVLVRLHSLGAHDGVRWVNGRFEVKVDAMAKIVDLIPRMPS